MKLAIVGFIGVMLGYLLISTVTVVPSAIILVAGVALFAGCGGLVEPALGSLLSRAAGPNAQGAVQGGGQAIQSLAMMLGPLWSGWLFAEFGPATPYWSASIWIGLAILATMLATPRYPRRWRAQPRHGKADNLRAMRAKNHCTNTAQFWPRRLL